MLKNENLEAIEIFDDVLYDHCFDDSGKIMNYVFVSLEAGLLWLTEKLEKQTGIHTELQKNGKPAHVDKYIRSFLIQGTQELLMNVATRHNAQNAAVSIAQNGRGIEVSVEDDGTGYDPTDMEGLTKHVGGAMFLKLRERLHNLGGQLLVESKPNQGTRVTMVVPPYITKGH